MECILYMQGSLNIKKSVNVTHHINRPVKKMLRL